MPRDHEWTLADLAQTPDDGLRYELVDGVLLVSPGPSKRHQIAVGELHLLLRAACPPDARVMRDRRPGRPLGAGWRLVDGAYVEVGHAEGGQPLELVEPFPARVVPRDLLDL